MSEKIYYEKYWQDKLPPMKFFNEPPKWPEKTMKQYVNFVKKWIESNDAVMDYGSGEGHFIGSLKHSGLSCGVDISEEAVARAKLFYPHSQFFTIEETNFTNKHDAITCFDVFEHIFDFDDVFDYFKKNLRNGGRLIIATNENCFIKMLAISLFYMNSFFHPYSPHIRFFTRKTLQALLESKGYKVLHYERTGNQFGFLSTGQFMVAEKG